VNFLAHFHLAWPDESLVLGGLEGDFHKGLLPGNLSPGLQAGVALHRAIDAYTDSHTEIVALRRLFPAELRRYAGILIDLCFDHVLAQQWDRYCALPRDQFINETYSLLSRHSGLLSEGAALMASRMREYDLLTRYQHWETIAASAARIGQRLSRENPLHKAGDLLLPLLPELEQSFAVFYPQLIEFSRHNVMLATTATENKDD
jgi:acyl carrier protein phosphodiesterase